MALPGPGAGGWVWPWWLERQLDPGAPGWQPADLVGHNRTGRNWTVIGIPEGDDRWRVDRRGLLAPSSGGWAVDWWIGSDDRWRLPSRDASVRQRLVDGAPVLETVLRVPGGEVVARHWAVPGDPADLVVMEIDNSSAAPVAVALALRPAGPTGPTGMRRVAVEGRRLKVDGCTVLVADVAPRQSVVSDAGGGDVAAVVVANATPATRDTEIACPSGWATAAMVWPLAHRATLRVEIPGTPRARRPGRPEPSPRSLRPGPAATAKGWSARATRRTRLDLPVGPIAAALEAQRRHLLLGLDPDLPRIDGARVVAALSTAGLRDEAGVHLGGWLDDQHRTGRLGGDDVDTAATLWALDAWARTGADDGLLARSPIAIARAVERCGPATSPGDPVAATWGLAGLEAGARMLAALGEEEAAGKAQRWGRERSETLMTALGTPAGTAAFGPSTEAALLAVGLGVLAPRHPVAAAARVVARRPFAGVPAGAVAGPQPMLGLRPELTLAFAVSAALAGDHPDEAIGWVLSVASPTWTWPTVVAPRLGTGSHGSGHDPSVAAALWTCGRALLVADAVAGATVSGTTVSGATGTGATVTGDAGVGSVVHLVPTLLDDWLGVDFEVHGVDTAAGSLSYAVRWHGERPALLWDIVGTGPEPTLSAYGLDPTWRGGGHRGEALLGVVAGRDDRTGVDPTDTGPSLA